VAALLESVALALVLLLQTGLIYADSGCSITKHLVHGMMQWPPATIAVTKGELETNWNITDPYKTTGKHTKARG